MPCALASSALTPAGRTVERQDIGCDTHIGGVNLIGFQETGLIKSQLHRESGPALGGRKDLTTIEIIAAGWNVRSGPRRLSAGTSAQYSLARRATADQPRRWAGVSEATLVSHRGYR